MSRICLSVLFLILCGCGQSSTIQIGPGSEPFEISDNQVFINSDLLGLGDKTVDITTSRSNDLGVKITPPKESSIARNRAF